MCADFSPDGSHLVIGGGHGYVPREFPGRIEIWQWEFLTAVWSSAVGESIAAAEFGSGTVAARVVMPSP